MDKESGKSSVIDLRGSRKPVVAILLHERLACFDWPLCDHEGGSRFAAVERALEGREGRVLSITGRNGVIIDSRELDCSLLWHPADNLR